MANELANAATLMRDETFRDWIMAAAVYQARQVIVEPDTTANHAIRERLAQDVIVSPAILVERLVNVIATDPDVAAKGNTVDLIGQTIILQKVAAIWTHLARLAYPMGA